MRPRIVGVLPVAVLGWVGAVGGWWFTSRHPRESCRNDSETGGPTRRSLGHNLVVAAVVAASCALSACAAGGADLEVVSPDLRDGSLLEERFTCTGDNAVPTISWRGAPPGTQGFAVVVEDPDAPTGTFTHWVVTGLGPAARSVCAELPPGAVAGITSSGKAGYVGPCPPNGQEHRFRYRVHALREMLILDPATPLLEARRRIESLSLDAAEVEVRYRTP